MTQFSPSAPTSIPRSMEARLLSWASSSGRKVLLLRGARQVGKTFLVRALGRRFRHFLEVNFLSDKRAREIFAGDIDIPRIISQLSALFNTPLVDGESLLFFDEVQECPGALEALRFFYEKRPNLAVIAAGSLLEFALAELPSFGVGRVQSIFIQPISFPEYLGALGEHGILEHLRSITTREIQERKKETRDPLHEKLTELFRVYLLLGGLPEVVAKFASDRDFLSAGTLIDTLRRSYEDDFIKYKGRTPEFRLREVFQSTALQAGKKFVHTHAYIDANARAVSQCLELINQAGIVHKVFHSSANGLPLGAEIDPRRFKCLPFDHGIYQRMIGTIPAELMSSSFDPINKGALAEVYAACSLVAASDPLQRPQLYYWSREAKSSNAEVDYVLELHGQVVPLEIKAGTKGAMQSLHRFMHEKGSVLGVRSSLENFSWVDNVLILPLYALSELDRLVKPLL